jgi:NAD(P)-dependent dehydrogenase (short-subunit alcohol dehydrogenase family)
MRRPAACWSSVRGDSPRADAGGSALSLRADAADPDAADPDAVTAAVGRAADTDGRLDVLVSNAGVASVGGLEALALEEIDRMTDVNVRGVVHTVRATLPHLGDGGRVVTIGSVNAATNQTSLWLFPGRRTGPSGAMPRLRRCGSSAAVL